MVSEAAVVLPVANQQLGYAPPAAPARKLPRWTRRGVVVVIDVAACFVGKVLAVHCAVTSSQIGSKVHLFEHLEKNIKHPKFVPAKPKGDMFHKATRNSHSQVKSSFPKNFILTFMQIIQPQKSHTSFLRSGDDVC